MTDSNEASREQERCRSSAGLEGRERSHVTGAAGDLEVVLVTLRYFGLVQNQTTKQATSFHLYVTD